MRAFCSGVCRQTAAACFGLYPTRASSVDTRASAWCSCGCGPATAAFGVAIGFVSLLWVRLCVCRRTCSVSVSVRRTGIVLLLLAPRMSNLFGPFFYYFVDYVGRRPSNLGSFTCPFPFPSLYHFHRQVRVERRARRKPVALVGRAVDGRFRTGSNGHQDSL